MISNTKSYIGSSNRVRKKASKPKPVRREFSYEDMDNSLRFHEEKKRQKQNWKKYVERIDDEEE